MNWNFTRVIRWIAYRLFGGDDLWAQFYFILKKQENRGEVRCSEETVWEKILIFGDFEITMLLVRGGKWKGVLMNLKRPAHSKLFGMRIAHICWSIDNNALYSIIIKKIIIPPLIKYYLFFLFFLKYYIILKILFCNFFYFFIELYINLIDLVFFS